MLISLGIAIVILFFILGIKLLLKKEIEADRFVPGWENEKSNNAKFENINKNKLSFTNRILLILIVGIIIGLLVYAITGKILATIIASFLGLISPNIWYKWYLKNQNLLIAQQMEQASETMSAVLKSNGSMIDALEKAARETKEPLKSELNNTAKELRLGVSSTNAFIDLAKRVKLPEMLMLSIGIDLQQKGMAINTAQMLLQVQKNIRQRQLLQQEIKTITVENKMAGWIVGSIPFVVIAIMRKLSPEFTAPLFNTTIGLTIFSICSVVIIIGIYWIISMASIEKIN